MEEKIIICKTESPFPEEATRTSSRLIDSSDENCFKLFDY